MKTKRARDIRKGDVIRWAGEDYAVLSASTVYPPGRAEEVLTLVERPGLSARGINDVRRFTWEPDDDLEVEGEWTRVELDAVIQKFFPDRLGTFYAEGSWYIAAVEDYAGDMWRVWADGNTQLYRV